MSTFAITADDPAAPDVRALLASHLAFARRASPPEDVHALEVAGLLAPGVSFFSLRSGRTLLGIGALKELDHAHGEIKSMHTVAAARGAGHGRTMLDHLISIARARGYLRVSLETGSMAAFAPARALYTSAGFAVCQPFADYVRSPHSVCMTLDLSTKQ